VSERDTVLVCGSRSWTDVETIDAWIWDAVETFPVSAVRLVHGDARGADRLAADIVRERYDTKTVSAYPVDHALDGPWPAAGPRRNARMLAAELPRIRRVLAFALPGRPNRGTADMIERCFRAGLAVTIVTPGSRP
jgi:hypothetical protein